MLVRFGEFGLDWERRQLLRRGDPVHLSPKAFEILGALISARPRALAKRDLQRAVWRDVIVTEGNLAVLVSEIRSALGDSPRQPRFVRTVHGYGYAFCATAAEVRPAASAPRAWLVWEGGRALLTEGEHELGRDPEAPIHLPYPGVSRRHARLRIEGGQVLLEDLGSKNGTYLGERKLTGPVTLSDGDRIRFGTFVATLRLWSLEASTDTEAGG